jgi:putative transposase
MNAYKFRLYPSKRQEQTLFQTFKFCRFVYNQLLEKLNKQTKINRGEIQHSILGLKKEFPELKGVYSKTLQYECYRLFNNLRGLNQLKKNGKKVGKLRFKGRDWFKTINYNQSGFKLKQEGKRFEKVSLSKIGEINIRCHRIIKGKIKQITIKKTAGKWYAIMITNEVYEKQGGKGKIGVDLGIINFIADNKGKKIKSPLFLKKSLSKIKKAHQNLSKKKKGSNNRHKAKQRLGVLFEKVENQRNDFLHKISTKLVSENKVICIEKLGIKQMMRKERNRFWNRRNFADVSWGKFVSMLKFKAESAGTKMIEVNPRNTSKKCSNCGTLQDMPLSQRTYFCDCGLELDRDENSARNILAQGLGFVENETVSSSMKQEAITLTQQN